MRRHGGAPPDRSLRRRRRVGLVSAGLAWTVLVVMTSARLAVSDRTWWGECLAVWPPLLWACVPLLLALAAWSTGERRAAAWTAAGTQAAMAATVEWTSLFRRPDADRLAAWEASRGRGDGSPLAVRVVSWNVSRERVLPALEPLRPEFGLFQESSPPHRDLARPAWAGFTFEGGEDPGTLSRWPVSVLPTEKVGPWQPPLLLLAQPPGGRWLILANVRLALPEVVLAVADPFGGHDVVRGHAARVAQFRKLARLLARTEEATGTRTVVLCGDFNTPADLASLHPLRERYRDAWRAGGVGWGGTMGEDLPVVRIDQCWVSPDVEVVRARVLRGRPSDHRMLMVDVLLP